MAKRDGSTGSIHKEKGTVGINCVAVVLDRVSFSVCSGHCDSNGSPDSVVFIDSGWIRHWHEHRAEIIGFLQS